MTTALHATRAVGRTAHSDRRARLVRIARVGSVSLALAALVAWSFAGYLTPDALLSLLTGFSLCG
ncbi:hypothetical protein [Burkholderia stagnalis]|uniref:Iron ABC transporter permease n=1 Tax=Burkholderia stagnalis TaxID=1503054 RepID=A0ABX9YRG8_9BURK|nr:hypothetical protein [Burkholderia stagnalis]KVC59143.1 hypothetical protein WS59_21840 [Burkholderia stagnalis]KVN21991.1 hypothetical protein WT10_11685 [Burkholderia stagnalis]KWI65472.1 hypothetical protein WT75_29005 [Burkholderia stagnalis]KWK09539.1 hypothetical protein WT76_10495 [Burkholderia stagnalis]KWK63165.1 hypothetical protein WT82_03095 [Burkholderia stagnalis]